MECLLSTSILGTSSELCITSKKGDQSQLLSEEKVIIQGCSDRNDAIFHQISKSSNTSSSLNTTSEGKKKKLLPNFFIGIRLPGIEQDVKDLQLKLSSIHPDIARHFTPIKKMHITLFVLTLTSPEMISKAATLLSQFETRLLANAYVALDKLQSFGSNVLYISVKEDDTFCALRQLCAEIHEVFSDNGFFDENACSRQKFDWIPHATIAKVRKSKKKFDMRKFNSFSQIGTIAEKAIVLETIDLLEMSRTDDSGYFKSHMSIKFPI
jgi:2'-5' RNA ligase